MNPAWQQAKEAIDNAQHIVVLQAENPDGDSLGSALALEELLSEMGKRVSLFGSMEPPKYLHYINGWDRVEQELPTDFDCVIVVDASVKSLFENTLTPQNTAALRGKPFIIFDHHAEVNSDDHLSQIFPQLVTINEPRFVATGELLLAWATAHQLTITAQAAEDMAIALLSDSLGLTVEAVTADTLRHAAELIDLGANISTIETRRREFSKKSQEILYYKGELLQRIEYFADGQFALVHVPWAEIEKYSHQYNPAALVIDEMRLVDGVQVAIVLKTYPDGKLTGKIRTTPKLADKIAKAFGGGGNPYAAGFKMNSDDPISVKHQLVAEVDRILREHQTATEENR